MEYLFVGLGGVLGALSRFSLGKIINRRWPGKFPWGTFFVNITGSFLLGMLFMFFTQAWHGVYLKNLLATGFMGAYTTYSTFSYEIISLMNAKEKSVALTYMFTSVVLGAIAAFWGISLGQILSAR